jgi:hypothetical protein
MPFDVCTAMALSEFIFRGCRTAPRTMWNICPAKTQQVAGPACILTAIIEFQPSLLSSTAGRPAAPRAVRPTPLQGLPAASIFCRHLDCLVDLTNLALSLKPQRHRAQNAHLQAALLHLPMRT